MGASNLPPVTTGRATADALPLLSQAGARGTQFPRFAWVGHRMANRCSFQDRGASNSVKAF
jgi:hypothetical protein